MKGEIKVDINIGDTVYVNSAFYLSHAADDFVGGKATVTEIKKQMSGGKITTFIRIKENPNSLLNWGQVLSKEQEKLAEEFGNSLAHPQPDLRPEFNKWD